jgi:hypothetical protein
MITTKMPETEKEKTGKSTLTADIKSYIEKRVQLLSYTIAENVSAIIAEVIAESIQRITGLIFVSAGVLFAWIAFGFYLGELLESLSLGFLLSSLPPFLAGLVILKRKSKIVTEKIQAEIISKTLNKLENSERVTEKEEDRPES